MGRGAGNLARDAAEGAIIAVNEVGGEAGAFVNPNPPKRDVRVVDTRDDGQGKANGPSQIPIDGDEGGVRAAPLARCWRPCGHGGGNSAGGRQEVALADRVGASWRGRSVGQMAGQWQTGCRQVGSGRARNRARASLNWFSQGQRWGRCKVRRRAELVSRPAIEKKRRRRVLVVTTCWPRPMRAVQRARLWAIPAPPARQRWRRSGPRGDG